MNQGHVLASMMFPSFPRYCGQVFHEAKDRELGLLCVQAWNDFIPEEFAAAYPGRFIPQMIIAMAGKWLAHLPQDTQDKITVGNAARVYHFTPADPATNKVE
jgi:hypothetical protein